MNLATEIVRWSLLVVTLLFIISGFGITEFRVVENITFGLFTKQLTFRMHEYLWIPFLFLLVLHVFIHPVRRLFLSKKGRTK